MCVEGCVVPPWDLLWFGGDPSQPERWPIARVNPGNGTEEKGARAESFWKGLSQNHFGSSPSTASRVPVLFQPTLRPSAT